MTGRRLRVGVDARLMRFGDRSGHGKVWTRVTQHLSELADLVAVDLDGRRRLFGRRLDVMLADGHAPLPPTGRIPIVAQVHEAAWFEPELERLLDPAFVAHIAPLTETAVLGATRVIVPSESARRDIAGSYEIDSNRVDVAHHGVDPVFRPGVADEEVARLTGDAPYVLFAAMIHPRKNLAAVRSAVTDLARDGFPHRLAIVGGPATDRPDSRQLEADATADLPGAPGRIIRFGELTDEALAALMANAAAFCLPSLYEGFGLTALEAMACGTVPVVSDRGALPEVVGEAGLVTDPTGEAVADALRTLFGDADLASRQEAAAREHARAFTWEATARRWLDSLERAASGG